MAKKHKKILVAMSGGVDSSVAAALLVEAGYDVTGAFMVNYEDGTNCWRIDYQDALRVAAKLGIKLLKLDFTKEYKELVLDYMYKEYEEGRTPNPDVLCNKFVKFGVWLHKLKRLGFDKIATGHYASVKNGQLLQAKDDNKDQTYFLHQLNQDQLASVVFPLGKYKKDKVRKLARKFNLPVAEKEESMGICFVGEVPMDEFLKDKVKTKPGKVINTAGDVLGDHDGLAFYTIGQRHIKIKNAELLKIKNANKKPLYVVSKNLKTNELVVGEKNDQELYKDKIGVEQVHWISGQESKFPLKCKVRLRHRQVLQNAVVTEGKEGVLVKFKKAQRAVAPGQFAVFYKNGECLGGGVIL